MSDGIPGRIEAFEGVGIITRYDRPTGTWIFICLHDDSLGSTTGGTRMRQYPDPGDGLNDAMRLSQGMTHKWAALGLPFGGAKAVLATSRPLEGSERIGLLERYGRLIESLGGIFATGEDLGTTPEDFKVIARQTRYVHGIHPQTREKIDPGPFTARGVFHGMEAAVREVFGSGLEGRKVMVQGAGHVGGRLVDLLHDAGAAVLVTDIDQEAAESAAARVGGATVPAQDAYTTECDVYSPCAIGATLNADTVPRLRCRLVAGSANNQLAEAEDARRLHERGIVYTPDYIINAGGALAFALLIGGEGDTDVLFDRMTDIGSTVAEVLSEAAKNDESPVTAAGRRVERTLQEARSASPTR